MRGSLLALAFLSASSLLAADVPKVSPFPVIPVNPKVDPPPKVDPDAVPVLADGLVFPVKADEDFILRAAPPGLVRIDRSGPATVYGSFVGGSGFEKRTFVEKNLAMVTAVPGAKGRVYLTYSPVGAKDTSTDLQVMLDVNGARPPPDDPKVDPIPEPKPKPKPKPVTSFRVIWVTDSAATLPLGQSSVIGAKSVRDYLNANCTKDGTQPGWRSYSKNAEGGQDGATMNALWAAVKPSLTTIPCVAIEVNGKATIEPFPATPAAALALLTKYKGGK